MNRRRAEQVVRACEVILRHYERESLKLSVLLEQAREDLAQAKQVLTTTPPDTDTSTPTT